jgi:alpha-galactosidase
MSDSILRLQSAGADVVIKTHPFAEIIYWGPHLSHFSPQDAASLRARWPTVAWTSIPRSP